MRQSSNVSLPATFFIAAALAIAPAVSASPPEPPQHITQAIANADRPQADRDRDADRKPAQVLAFFGVSPGMTMLDLQSGGGYYTEILSSAVGSAGKVYAHNDDLYWGIVKDRVGERYGRLKNVVPVQANLPDLAVEPDSADIALLVLAFHDFYYTPDRRPEAVDVPAALAAIKRALKPGGVFGVIDHAAKAGSPPETGHTLHRIDEALVKRLALEAGFVQDGEADFLRNPDDDRTQNPFAEGLRGKTDRFILLFRKPKS